MAVNLIKSQFVRVFFRTQPPHPHDIIESKLLKMVNIPGLDYQEVFSDWRVYTEFNLLEVLEIIEPDQWDEWEPGDELENAEEKLAHLKAFLTRIFQACMTHSNLFFLDLEIAVESWTLVDRLHHFYHAIHVDVITRGFEGGGFTLNTGDPELDAPNPGNLDELTVDSVREIVHFITVTRMMNISNLPADQTAPDTSLTRVMELWICQTEFIAGAHPGRPELNGVPEDE